MPLETLLLPALGLAVAAYALSRAFKRALVFEYEQALLYRAGRPTRVLAPGVHWWSPHRERLQKLDMRPRYVTLGAQEVLSADHVGFKITLAARYEIADALKAVSRSAEHDEAAYLELQLALREVIGGATGDEVLERRGSLGQLVFERARPRLEALGLTLLASEVKDVMFPGELKRLYAQVARARQEGLAALERARGETAALRNLANAARLVEAQPALLQLRMLQALGESSGHTIVWGATGGVLPVGPKESRPAQEPPSEG